MADLDIKIQGYGDQVSFIEDRHRYALLVGGIGSGKTHGGVSKALLFCSEHKKVDGIVTAPDYNRIHGSIIPMYLQIFPESFWKEKPHGNPPEAETILGNRIFFRTTTNPEDLRSYNVGWVHEDECAYDPYEAYQVLQGRLRSIEDAQWWGTTSPNKDNPLNWTYGEFFTKNDPSHIAFHLSTLDNPFLPESYKRDLQAQYSGDLQLIELQGLFIPIAGNCFFDTVVLREMLDSQVIKPIASRRNGDIRIYKPVGIGKKYVAGIDTAEGRQAGETSEGSGNPDYYVLRIMDFHTGEDVAILHARWPMDESLDQSVKLLREYNNAFVGLEVNFNKGAAKKLIDLGYPATSVYHREKGKSDREAGWLTSSLTRMPMLTEYEEAIRNRSVTMYDKDCIMEHLSFIRKANGRPEAANNAHDDYVISGAIAWQMRKYAKFPGSSMGKVKNFRSKHVWRF